MNYLYLKNLLIALFAIVFVIGFVVNNYHTFFAIALVVILATIVYVGGKVEKTTNNTDSKKS